MADDAERILELERIIGELQYAQKLRASVIQKQRATISRHSEAFTRLRDLIPYGGFGDTVVEGASLCKIDDIIDTELKKECEDGQGNEDSQAVSGDRDGDSAGSSNTLLTEFDPEKVMHRLEQLKPLKLERVRTEHRLIPHHASLYDDNAERIEQWTAELVQQMADHYRRIHGKLGLMRYGEEKDKQQTQIHSLQGEIAHSIAPLAERNQHRIISYADNLEIRVDEQQKIIDAISAGMDRQVDSNTEYAEKIATLVEWTNSRASDQGEYNLDIQEKIDALMDVVMAMDGAQNTRAAARLAKLRKFHNNKTISIQLK